MLKWIIRIVDCIKTVALYIVIVLVLLECEFIPVIARLAIAIVLILTEFTLSWTIAKNQKEWF